MLVFLCPPRRIIHQSGFSADERAMYKQLVFSNTMQALVNILTAMNDLGIPLENPNLKVSTDRLSLQYRYNNVADNCNCYHQVR